MSTTRIEGNMIDVINEEIYGAEITFKDKILAIRKTGKKYEKYISPGLVDCHIHIESSMLCPSRFAAAAAVHGTVGTVSDPHEIANVLGMKGINYMIEDASKVPVKIKFAAPSCVPATSFETSGAILGPDEIEELLKKPEIVALGEVMNFPGVINRHSDVIAKIRAAEHIGKPIDGHAPMLKGEDLVKYNSAGISTDHECSNAKEAEEKIKLKMKILVREGSSAKNMKELIKISKPFAFVSDDLHADDLLKGHMNAKLAKAVKLGMAPMQAIQMATINPVTHYGLEGGALAENMNADIVVFKDLKDFEVLETYIDGVKVAENGKALFEAEPANISTGILTKHIKKEQIQVKSDGRTAKARVIKIVPKQLITKEMIAKLDISEGTLQSSPRRDILKLVVADRYGKGNVGVGFVQGFGLKEGAIASTVAHDSHNIICAGVSDEHIIEAMTLVMKNGGLAYAGPEAKALLELPIAGLMSDRTASEVAKEMDALNKIAKNFGSKIDAPFMTLSFLALLVIPKLKLSDKGLFDGIKFEFLDVVAS